MPFLTEVHFQNYRSFLDAKCRLSPVTLVIGANNAGKSNFLRGVMAAARGSMPDEFGRYFPDVAGMHPRVPRTAHSYSLITLTGYNEYGIRTTATYDFEKKPAGSSMSRLDGIMVNGAICYDLDHRCVGGLESAAERPFVEPNGEGVTRVLQSLQAHHPAGFKSLVDEFKKQIPEVAELMVRLEDGSYRLWVLESGLIDCWPISDLSPGARTVLALLAIVYQSHRPELILLEDIEHAIHPRGIAEIVETMRRISAEHGVQFIMTSHHPYVLDCFRAKEHWGDVVIVEKKDGVSRLANMDDRLKRLHYEEEMDKVRLHELWYSGLMGGVANPPPAWDKEA